MDETPRVGALPEAIQRLVTICFTVLAAALYALILGTAMVQTARGLDSTLTDGALRAVRVLGGVVGAVVSAGFAGSWRSDTVQLSAKHPMAGDARTGWFSLRPTSRFQRKFASLSRTLGFAGRVPAVLEAEPGSDAAPAAPDRASLIMTLTYVGVYFVLGVVAFVLVLFKQAVPEIVENSAWTWLGTVIASVYTYFGMDAAA
ncbi:MAG: hypothetical protein GX557_00470 [Chloroflexi bacterium]|nr:hypothetical protein [Chloroflexota bacterium]